MSEPYEGGIELSEEDEAALDRAWAAFALEYPGYRASPEDLERLRGLGEHRAALYRRMPTYAERLEAMRAVRKDE